MIPILYESNETQFQSNGIGRLTDCISCKVSEERNGIYECEFEYPVDGHRYEDIVEGRIIAVKHDDTDDIQPFDIYGHSAPIDGIVTFYAHHISYRLGEITVKPFSASSCAETFEKLKQNSLYGNPFTFWTDKSVNVEFEMDTPFNLKEYLGGTEGSILDVFGTGEYEFDKWLVKFHQHRGTDTNVQIRYGKNLADLQDEEDWSGCYTSVVPYWFGQDQETDEDVLVTLDNWILSSGQSTYGGREIIVPMDLSGEWQDPPTKAQLQQTATQRLMLGEGWMPSKSVKVDFVHLWQTEEYKEYAPLQRVKLCDTVTVIYPKLGMEFTKKVVSVKYDALLERYDEITLGESTTSFGNLISTETAKQVANAKLYLRKIIKNTNYALQQNMEDEIQHVTDLITGGLGGYAVWGFNANGYPEELFFLDQPSVETAVNVLRINKNGIGFSTSGVNGTYTTAWTIDGHFVADFITSGVLTANVIRSGLLSDVVGNNYWNLDTGEFKLSWTGTKVGDDSLGTTVNKATRSILNHANAYGLGWKVNHNSFTAESNGECWYHGYADDGTASSIDGWVYWNGEQVTIPRGYGINPNNTMPFDTVLYSVFRTSDSKYHDVVWTGTQWEGNTYTASSGTNWTPSARAVWTWNEDTDIILASYLLPSAEGAIYGAQLFTPPKKYSELAEKVESKLSKDLSDFATQVTEQIEDIQEQLDGVVDTYYYSYKPTLANEPASTWTTDADKTNHIGDMFYDTSTGKVYRWVTDATNLVPYPYAQTTKTTNGITYTDNGDGTITANGTSTGNAWFTVTNNSVDGIEAGNIYVLTGRSGSDTKIGIRIDFYDANNTSVGAVVFNSGSEKMFTAPQNTVRLFVQLYVLNGTTVSNFVFSPKIVLKYGWVEIPDTEAQQALQLASEAKDTADHKRRVFIVTPYVPYDQGDIWMQGTNGDILVCLEGKTSTEAYSETDWGKLNKYTDESTTISIVEEKVNSIEIGGRNLLYDTNAPTLGAVDGDGARYWSSQPTLTNGTADWVEITDSPVAGVKYGAKLTCTTTGGSTHGPVFYAVPAGEIRDFIDWKNGQTYTFSYYAKSSVVGATLNTALGTASHREWITDPTITIDTANKWVRYVLTFKYTGSDDSTDILWTVFQYNVVGTVYMCGFQLEIGNMATDWSEYPRTETTYSGRNLIRNTNNVDLLEHSTKPNINGYYNDGTHYGNVEFSSGTATASEHGVKITSTSASAPTIRFGTGSTTASVAEKNGTFGLEEGQQYTWSFDYEYKLYSGADTTSVYYLSAYIYQWTGSAWQLYEAKHIDPIYVAERGTVKSGRGFFTFTVPEDKNIQIQIRPYTNTASLFASGDYLELKNMKLEKGTDATDWSAAPEDIAGDIVDVYVKSGGRNYITGTGTPFEWSIGENNTNVVSQTQYNTYLDQTLEDLGFAVGDKLTVSYDWEVSDVIDDTYGTFHLELRGKTSSSDYAHLGLLNPNITVSASNLSGHCTNTITLNSTTIKGYTVACQISTMTATLKISNLKLEKEETESRWTVAPEDASIPASGANMLRGTDASKDIGTGQWNDGTWRNASSGSGTRTRIDVDDATIPKIKHGFKITATSYTNSLANAVCVGQSSVPHIESGKHYVMSCYAKGTGYLLAGAGVTSYVFSYIRLNNVTAWTRYEIPIVMPHTSAYMNLTTNKTNVFFGATGVDADISICALKMEEGLSATEWRPAVEDLEEKPMYGTCPTSANITAKVVTCDGFKLYSGAKISVYFTYGNSVNNPTLNVNGTGAIPIYARGSAIASPYWWSDKSLVEFTYNGSQWIISAENQEETFNRLTNGSANQGIYLDGGKLYINATYIKSGTVSANYISGGTIDATDVNLTNLNGSNITTGTIKDSSGNTTWNLSTGALSSKKLSITSTNFTLTEAGVITATSGTIGGFTLDSTSIHTKDVAITSNASNSLGLSSSTFTRTIGGTSRSNLKLAIGSGFGVTNAGKLYASGAEISGAITATSGSFTGTVNATSGSFTGTIEAGSGSKIGNWIIGTGLQNKSSGSDVYFTPTELKLGAFKVTSAGALTAGSLSVSTAGRLTLGNFYAETSGAIGGSNWSISAAGVANFKNTSTFTGATTFSGATNLNGATNFGNATTASGGFNYTGGSDANAANFDYLKSKYITASTGITTKSININGSSSDLGTLQLNVNSQIQVDDSDSYYTGYGITGSFHGIVFSKGIAISNPNNRKVLLTVQYASTTISSISANGTASATITIPSSDDYSILGVVGWWCGQSAVHPYQLERNSDTEISVRLRNVSSSAITNFQFAVRILKVLKAYL